MMRGHYEKPNGLFYYPEFISEEEEKQLLRFIEKQDFNPFILKGYEAKRLVKNYGFRYDFDTNLLEPGEPIPQDFFWLIERCAEKAAILPEKIIQCLIIKYPPGSTISWHTDRLAFGSRIFGISLASSCHMRFQRKLFEKSMYLSKNFNQDLYTF